MDLETYASSTFVQVGLYLIRIIMPFLAIYIIWQCFTSMRKHARAEHPLIILFNTLTRDKIPVLYWENSIGRSKSSDIILADPTVSRDHAVLYRRDEGWLISDTGSKSGVYVNGNKIDNPEVVYPNDTISIGATSLVLSPVEDSIDVKKSWFFDKKIGHRVLMSGTVLFLITLAHFLLCIQLIFAKKSVDFSYFVPFVSVEIISWGFYTVSNLVFRRTNFEIESIALFLSGCGIEFIASVNIKYTLMQIVTLVFGIAVFCFLIWFMEIPDRVMQWRTYIMIGAIAVLALNLVLGSNVHGSRNWIRLGSISIQPSEFIKIVLVLVGSSTLDRLQTTKNLTEFIVFTAICVGALFLMGDFGGACIFFVTFLIISFMRSGNTRTIVLIIAAAVLGVFIILKFKPYIADRFAVWRHAWQYVDTTGYQQTRVLSYASSGGLFGLGLGQGYLKNIFAAESDIIFGVICEEAGLLFALIIPICLACLAFYARQVSSSSRSTIYSIASCGAAGMLVFQTCLNVFGATDILPMTGVTLPFISLGGSSMISVWGLLAFIKSSDEVTYSKRRGLKDENS